MFFGRFTRDSTKDQSRAITPLRTLSSPSRDSYGSSRSDIFRPRDVASRAATPFELHRALVIYAHVN